MSAQSSLTARLHTQLSPAAQQILLSAGISGQTPITQQHDPIRAQSDVPETVALPEPTDAEKMALFDQILTETEQLQFSDSSNPSSASSSDAHLLPTTPSAALPNDIVPAVEHSSDLLNLVPPQSLAQATEDLWQQSQAVQAPSASTAGKERLVGSGWSLDGAVQEAGGGIAAVETEPAPELSAEVDNYLTQVDQQKETPAEKIAQLIPTVATAPAAPQLELVRVIPLTKKMADQGRKKSPKYSIRWLVAFGEKLSAMFKGKTVYLPD